MVKCMKKIIQKLNIFMLLWLLPLTVFAYSSEVILGGQNVGISINSQGVLIVGFYKVNNIFLENNLALDLEYPLFPMGNVSNNIL